MPWDMLWVERFGTMRLQVGHWMHSLRKSDTGLVGEWRLFVICGGYTTLSASTCVVQQVQVHIPGESCLSVDRTDEPFLFARTSHQTVTSMTIEVVFHERINRMPIRLEYSVDLSADEIRTMREYEIDLSAGDTNAPRLLEAAKLDISSWDIAQTRQLLHSAGLGQLVPAFEVGKLAGDVLDTMTSEEIERVIRNNLPMDAATASSLMRAFMLRLSSVTSTPGSQDAFPNTTQPKARTQSNPSQPATRLALEGKESFRLKLSKANDPDLIDFSSEESGRRKLPTMSFAHLGPMANGNNSEKTRSISNDASEESGCRKLPTMSYAHLGPTANGNNSEKRRSISNDAKRNVAFQQHRCAVMPRSDPPGCECSVDTAKAAAHANGYRKFHERLMPKGNGLLLENSSVDDKRWTAKWMPKGNGLLSTCPLLEKPPVYGGQPIDIGVDGGADGQGEGEGVDKAKASAHANGYQKFHERQMPKENGLLSTCAGLGFGKKTDEAACDAVQTMRDATVADSHGNKATSVALESAKKLQVEKPVNGGQPIDSGVDGGMDRCTTVVEKPVDNPSSSDIFKRDMRRKLLNSSSLPTKTSSRMDALEGPTEQIAPRLPLERGKSTDPIAITIAQKRASRMMDISVEDWFKLYPASPQAVTPSSISNGKDSRLSQERSRVSDETPPPSATSSSMPTTAYGQPHRQHICGFEQNPAFKSSSQAMDIPTPMNQTSSHQRSRSCQSDGARQNTKRAGLPSGRVLRESSSFKMAETSKYLSTVRWLLSELETYADHLEEWNYDEAGSPMPLDDETLQLINAATITSLDGAPDTRLLICAEAAGWDKSVVSFPEWVTHENLEMLALSLSDLLKDIQKFVNTCSDGARRRRELLRVERRSEHTSGSLNSKNSDKITSVAGTSIDTDSDSFGNVSIMTERQHSGLDCQLSGLDRQLSGGFDRRLSGGFDRRLSGGLDRQLSGGFDRQLSGLSTNSIDQPIDEKTEGRVEKTESGLSVTFSGLSRLSANSRNSENSAGEAHNSPPSEAASLATTLEALHMLPDMPGYNEIPYAELVFPNGSAGAHCRLGKGGYGEVFLASWSGASVAVKRLLEQEDCTESLQDFVNEVDILSQLRHTNVVLWLGACTKPPNLVVVLEAIYTSTKHGPRGRSLNYILHKTNQVVTRVQAFKWLEGVVKGMMYLHSRNVIHCDLNTNNVLVSKENIAKITDFGLSRIKVKSRLSNNPSQTGIGTVNSTAPEVLRGDSFDGKKADAFSFGVMMWEMAVRAIPWDNWKPLRVYANLVTNGCTAVHKQLVFPPGMPLRYSQLAHECWEDDPCRRPSFPKLLRQIQELLEEEKACDVQKLVEKPVSNGGNGVGKMR